MLDQPTLTTSAEWPLYRGTKFLKAAPSTKAEYCLLRGWKVPSDEDPNEIGYTVEYQDGGKPNLEGYDGYVSWSPADVFQRAYHRVGSFLDRLKIEHAELDERLDKLQHFIGFEPAFQALDALDQSILRFQAVTMDSYRTILSVRIEKAEANGG